MIGGMRGKWLLVAGLVLCLAVIAGLVKIRRTPPPAKAAPTGRLVLAPALPAEITVPGKVQAKSTINIPVPTDGIVERFLVEVGEDVFEGELLARIKNTRLDAMEQTAEGDLARAQSRVSDIESAIIAARLEASRSRADAVRTKTELDRAERAYSRQEMLYKEGATPRLVYEKAKADYEKLKADGDTFQHLADTAEERVAALSKELETARAIAVSKGQEVDEAKADLGAGEVHSPVNGVVLARNGKPGEPVVRAMGNLFELGTNLGTLDVVIAPDAKVLTRLRPGQQVAVLLAEAPIPLKGIVREIKAGQVFIEFSNSLPAIRPGLTAQVKIRLG